MTSEAVAFRARPPLIFYCKAWRLNFILRDILTPSLRRGIAFGLWAIAAVIVRGWIPWFYWLTVAALPCVALALEENEWLGSRTGRRVLWMCGGLFVLHAIWAAARAQFYDAASPGTFWRDDHNYIIEARAVAAAWHDGFYPHIWLKGALPYLGTLHTGYHRALATMFLAFGGSTWAGLLLNALCLCWMPLLSALSAKYLFESSDYTVERGTKWNRWQKWLDNQGGVPMAAAALTAVHPAQFYWTSFLMKDAWTAFTFFAAMTVALGAVQRRSAPLAIAAIAVLPYVITVRIYAGVSIILGLLLLPGLRFTRRQFFAGLMTAFAVFVLLFGYTERGTMLFEQVRDSFAALAPASAITSLDILKQIAAGIPRLFLAPYGWIILPEPSPMYGMYPGMWYLYLIGYPLGFAGLYAAIRRNIRVCVIPITAFGLAGLLFLTAAYGGNSSRQRYYLEYVVLVFAAYGVKYPSRGWFIGVCMLELTWAVGQVIALKY